MKQSADLQTILTRRFRVDDAANFDLSKYDPKDKADIGLSKSEGKALMKVAKKRLADLQDLLYANGTKSLLIVFQGMDTSGKDGTIKHVMSGVNPQGVTVSSFKQPGPQELLHGFLWRIHIAGPSAGRIVIFNRSHYEDVLVTRVHPELLEREHLPGEVGTPEFWQGRFDDIRNFEHYLSRQGTVVLKFFLNISREEQRKRLLRRLDLKDKRWKFSSADMKEREFWGDYRHAYEEAIRHTSCDHAPWFVIPANRKWFARLVVIHAIIDTMEKLGQKTPTMEPDLASSLDKYRQELVDEAG
ncbi:polyphosphate kinase 2 family protein [Acetobacter sacchari]|uniref:Polyphosphate kinase 2 family protein n=1 Tax=Acetobacter sacchari TaxID=2661687 RepID=A0ABS3LY54_9PROT|nr:PPK2 family polyphosphate kinase [Acetobacter sacchari]MBO1360828.1 polyphosphate kinase 2 family protein [Acetobacter sacchari]